MHGGFLSEYMHTHLRSAIKEYKKHNKTGKVDMNGLRCTYFSAVLFVVLSTFRCICCQCMSLYETNHTVNIELLLGLHKDFRTYFRFVF
jgi:hypothetical protein